MTNNLTQIVKRTFLNCFIYNCLQSGNKQEELKNLIDEKKSGKIYIIETYWGHQNVKIHSYRLLVKIHSYRLLREHTLDYGSSSLEYL